MDKYANKTKIKTNILWNLFSDTIQIKPGINKQKEILCRIVRKNMDNDSENSAGEEAITCAGTSKPNKISNTIQEWQ